MEIKWVSRLNKEKYKYRHTCPLIPLYPLNSLLNYLEQFYHLLPNQLDQCVMLYIPKKCFFKVYWSQKSNCNMFTYFKLKSIVAFSLSRLIWKTMHTRFPLNPECTMVDLLLRGVSVFFFKLLDFPGFLQILLMTQNLVAFYNISSQNQNFWTVFWNLDLCEIARE